MTTDSDYMAQKNQEDSTTAGIILLSLDLITVIIRFASRWVTKAGFGWDDWTILIALIAGILPGALTMWANTVSPTGSAAASNHDPNYVFTEDDILYTKIMLASSVLYFLITCATKISILLLLHRIFPTYTVNRFFRYQIYAAEAAVVMFWISATVADCLHCVPLEWAWKNGHADPRYCINFNTFWLATGVLEGVIDLVILALPLGVVSTLQLKTSKKFGVGGVFLLGIFVLFSGIAKVVLSYQQNSREPDYARAALWTTVHLYTGIICANLPPSWPLIGRFARFSGSSWVRLSSIGKRWGSSGGSGSSRSRDTKNEKNGSRQRVFVSAENKSAKSSTDDGNKNWDGVGVRRVGVHTVDIESGGLPRGRMADYEMAMYGRDGQVMSATDTVLGQDGSVKSDASLIMRS